jgi:hypothetical protein
MDATERAGRVGVLAGGEAGGSGQGEERRRGQAASEETGAQSVLLWGEVWAYEEGSVDICDGGRLSGSTMA